MIRFASLGSGSRGNSLVVDAGDTRLLLDCGFSVRAMVDRLARLSMAPEEIDGIVVSHEHGDHVAGVRRFAGRFGIPVYLTYGTRQGIEQDSPSSLDYRLIDGAGGFCIGSLEITPFTVPHDAREPVQYLFSDGTRRLGVLTDCGTITQHVIDILSGCNALMLECNHDPAMLAESNYPAMLKRRISGTFGHLDNLQAADLVRKIDSSRLQHVIDAHLSEQNNRPELVAKALAEVLGAQECSVEVASQDEGVGWREIL